MDLGNIPFSLQILCCLLLLFVKVIAGLTENALFSKPTGMELTWNLPRPVLGYRSYMDVYPTRYDVPAGLSSISWSFQVLVSSRSCGNFTVKFSLQQGGLPLVNQTSQSFPDNYFIVDSSSLHFELGLGQMISFALLQPSPGPWYVIAYTNEEGDGKIRQKGLYKDNKCLVNYISNLQLGNQLQRHYLSLSDFHSLTISKAGTLIGFTLPTSTYGFQVSITECYSPNCSLTLKYQPLSVREEISQECNNSESTPCLFYVVSPLLNDEQHVFIMSTNHETVNVMLRISSFHCKSEPSSFPMHCVTLHTLSRINSINPGFSNLGYVFFRPKSIHIQFGQTQTIVVPFYIYEPNDVGATLNWEMSVSSFNFNFEDPIQVNVCGGLVYNNLPDFRNKTFDACTNLPKSTHIRMAWFQRNVSMVYVPYPRAGIWHVVIQTKCFFLRNGSITRCPIDSAVDMSLNIQPCIHNGCGERGKCLTRTVGSELVTYSACKCYADYRGYGCQDDSHSIPKGIQIAEALLLTMSNLFFLPAVGIAIKRRFYLEALIYSYTMFFSTFYHACDGDRIDQYRLCIIKFDVLQSGDFFGSSSSLWITLVAMAAIRRHHNVASCLQVAGPLGLFIGVLYDKTSLYVIAVPIVIGLLLIIVSWGYKMYTRKKLYPSKRRYLFFLLPGVTLASVAAAIYSFIETESNYKYLHSMWHACIALSVCFLLPPKNGSSLDDSKSCSSEETAQTQVSSENNQGNDNNNGVSNPEHDSCDYMLDSIFP